ncbi:MAG TPA: ABC transporter permease [Mesorhizobium sp.]|jgi:ABC-type spermidine/putrescine transport system permease subunit I|nr:ABC transporter permease [Mesorhizobium sp.]
MTLARADSALAQAEPRPAKTSRRPNLAPWLLLSPALVIVLVFFGLPTLFMARMSFNLHIDQRLYVPGFTFEHYRTLFTNPIFTGAIWTTAQLALLSSLATVLIGYAFALLAWLKPARWRLLFIGLALCPLLISEIAIIFGWWMFFPKNGLLSYALVSSGLITDKISLMYTEFAAFVGLVYITLPYAFFILLSILDGIDRQMLESSADLGASPVVTFREVLLPLTRSGLLVAFSQAFIWAMGIYATPSALGPDTLWTMGFLIQEQMLGKHNWPLASALSMVLVVGVALVMILTRSLMSRQAAYHV